MATRVASEGEAEDPWADHRAELQAAAADIEDLQDQLQDAYADRADAVIGAWEDGMPQREIGYELSISHTMVQKIIAQEFTAFDAPVTHDGRDAWTLYRAVMP